MSFSDLIFPLTGSDSVAVFDSGFGQVFIDARPLRLTVHEESRLLEHPIETGQIITDYSIVMPVVIELQMIVAAASYRDTYQQIKTLYQNKEFLSVQTRADNYANMVIAEMPHDEKPEMYDALPITLRFKQILVVQSITNFAPADPTQADTKALGEQSSYDVAPVANVTGVAAPPPPAITGITPTSAQNYYSSVQAASNPTGYTISGLPGGDQQLTNNPFIPPVQDVPVTGLQTLSSEQTLIAGFR